MAIELKIIDKDFANKERLFTIYEESFPKNERMPNDEFLSVIRKYGCTLWAFFDQKEMLGFTCVMHNADYKIGYLWYFAIASDYRNRGYGGKALQLLQEKYEDSQLVLDMEMLDPKAENYRQRIRRLHFYERNGFVRAFVGMSYFGMDYELMSNHAPLRLDDFKAVIAMVANSLFHPVFSNIVSKTVLFLHGFFASGQCLPAMTLREKLTGKAEVISPDLPIHPKEAIGFIIRLCEEVKPDLLVGNSCGSFYAQQVAPMLKIPALLGNPHFEMSKFLYARLGKHNYKSPRRDGKQSFTIDEALVNEFTRIEASQFDHCNESFKEEIWGLFGENDTLAHYESMFLEHYTHSFHFPGGHTPTAEEVRIWYVPLVESMLEKERQWNKS